MLYRSFLATLLVSTLSGDIQAASDFAIGVGQVSLPDPILTPGGTLPNSYVVNFPIGSFDSTPVVFILPDTTNTDPMTLRVHSVSTSGFEVFVAESQGEDATTYPTQPFQYLAIEPGTYTFGGATLRAGLATNTTQYQQKSVGNPPASWRTITFPSPFAATPAVISQLQTINNDSGLLAGVGSSFNRTTQPWLELTTTSVTTSSFNVALERAENTAGTITTGEDIAWMAITSGQRTFGDDDGSSIQIMAFLSGATSITGDCIATLLSSSGLTNFNNNNPVYFASQITRNGGDGGWVRLCSRTASSVTVEIEEDRGSDAEQNHTGEQVAFIGFSQSFQTTDDDLDGLNFNMLVSSGTIPSRSASADSYSLSPISVSFNAEFGGNFSAAPVIVPMSTSQGNGEPAMVRVWDITSSGFKMAATAPERTTPAFVPADGMTVDFLAVVPGTDHILPDGNKIRAGTGLTTNCVRNGLGSCSQAYDTVAFGTSFTAPVVFAAAQSMENNSSFNPANPSNPFLSTSVTGIGPTGFQFSFELAQTNLAPVFAESYGWIAMEGGLNGSLRAAEGTTGSTIGTDHHVIDYRTLNTAGATIAGWGNNATPACIPAGTFTFPGPAFAALPLTIATHTSRNGSDGGWLRRCSLNNSSIGLVIDEDQTTDAERIHGSTERASIIAFSDTFAWVPLSFRLTKEVGVEWDPENLVDNPKAVPFSYQRYTVTLENLDRIGADNGDIQITTDVPEDTTLFVGDLDTFGCPIEWRDPADADASGLSFTCASDLRLATTPSCTNSPDVDGYCAFSTFSFGSDWDSTVDLIKIAPAGEFLGSTGANSPDFEFDFRVRID